MSGSTKTSEKAAPNVENMAELNAAGPNGFSMMPPSSSSLAAAPLSVSASSPNAEKTPNLGTQLGGLEGIWATASDYYGKIKRDAYKSIVDTLRQNQAEMIANLRMSAGKLSPTLQPVAAAIIDSLQMITDIFISLILAIIGLVVGFTSGIAAAIWGLVKLAYLIGLLISANFSQKAKDEWAETLPKLLDGLKNFVPNLILIAQNWKKRFDKANPDDQTLMIGELTGEIEALLATIQAGGHIAAQAPKAIPVLVPVTGPASAAAGTVASTLAGPGAASTLTMMTASNVDQKAQAAKQEKQVTGSKKKPPTQPNLPEKIAGPEVFDELSKELGLSISNTAKGVAGAVEDAVAAGFIDKKGNPQSIDLAVQSHKDASAVRKAQGKTGAIDQSAHLGPTSGLKKVAGYSRGRAETVLLQRDIHAAFDAHWKQWAQNLRRAGKVDVSVAELYSEMLTAIDQIPNIPQRMKNAMAWRMEQELFRDLALNPTDRVTLPYANITPK